MATYIVDSTGQNNAEITGDFTTNDVANTLTFNAGTDGEATPLKLLETTKQWLIIEVRAIGGVAGVLGKHVYSEDVIDILTRVNAIRSDMIALHSTFVISATHFKTGGVCDVYRGTEAAVVALAAADTNITYTPPNVWVIDDLTAFSPDTPVVATDLVVDGGYDIPTEHNLTGAGLSISGSKLNAVTTDNGRAYSNLTEALVDGASYRVGITCDAHSAGNYRLFVGNTSWPIGFTSYVGTLSDIIIYTAGEPNSISIQFTSPTTGTFDNFTCERI